MRTTIAIRILGVLALVAMGTLVVQFAFAQAQGASGGKNGKCDKDPDYRKCISDAFDEYKRLNLITKFKRDIEWCEIDYWKPCVEKKCKGTSSGSETSCPKNSDCEQYCTEEGSSTKGLVGCCVGGAKRKPSCLKKVDGKCRRSDSTKEPSFAEGEKPPYPPKDKMNPGIDPGMLRRPMDTRREHNPLSDHLAPVPREFRTYELNNMGKVMDPTSPTWDPRNSESSLPPEYRPLLEYVPPRPDERNMPVQLDGTTYSIPISRIRETGRELINPSSFNTGGFSPQGPISQNTLNVAPPAQNVGTVPSQGGNWIQRFWSWISFWN